MHEFLAATDSGTVKQRRPSILRIISNGVVLVGVVFFLVILAQATNDKNLRARVGYALAQTKELQTAAAVYYAETARWPISEEEAGLPLRQDFPDGGFYELQQKGVIRIEFEVKPELTVGSIVLRADTSNEIIEWDCRIVGNIDSRYVPFNCRE